MSSTWSLQWAGPALLARRRRSRAAEPADPDFTATTGADDPCVAVCDVGLGWTVCAVRAEALGGGVDEALPRDGGRPVLAPLDAGEARWPGPATAARHSTRATRATKLLRTRRQWVKRSATRPAVTRCRERWPPDRRTRLVHSRVHSRPSYSTRGKRLGDPPFSWLATVASLRGEAQKRFHYSARLVCVERASIRRPCGRSRPKGRPVASGLDDPRSDQRGPWLCMRGTACRRLRTIRQAESSACCVR